MRDLISPWVLAFWHHPLYLLAAVGAFGAWRVYEWLETPDKGKAKRKGKRK